jgi:hypothetical protein
MDPRVVLIARVDPRFHKAAWPRTPFEVRFLICMTTPGGARCSLAHLGLISWHTYRRADPQPVRAGRILAVVVEQCDTHGSRLLSSRTPEGVRGQIGQLIHVP